MKIAFGMRLIEGPWGGGNQFGKAFVNYFRGQGIDVCFDLRDPEIDIIVLTEPRRFSPSSAFTDADIVYYLTNINSRAIVVQRVNDSSHSREADLRSQRLAFANHCVHQTVFVSNWLQDIYTNEGFSFIEPVVIRNGADRSVFHGVGGRIWDGNEKLRVVTHHWSTNWRKGFDVYCEIDTLLGQRSYSELFEFTFVGRVPEDVKFQHTRVIDPLTGNHLADQLRSHHVYVSASLGEAAGNHFIEAAICGLPVLYRQSGSLPEYCGGFGLALDEGAVSIGLLNARNNYFKLKANMSDYPYDAELCCSSYHKLFSDLLAKRDEVLQRRRWTHLNGWIFRSCSNAFDLLIKGYDRIKS